MTATAYTPTPTSPDQDQIQAVAWFVSVVRKRWRVVAATAFGVFLLVVPPAFFGKRQYSSSSSFMPSQPRAQLQGVAGLAAQFGISPLGAEGAGSPNFYAELLTTREVLRAVAAKTYTVKTPQGVMTKQLDWFYDVTADDSAGRVNNMATALSKIIIATVSTRTGIVHVVVRAPYPDLAEQVDEQLIDEINRFNLERRKSQASAERKFTEERVAVLRDSMARAEDRLANFLRGNIQIGTGEPSLGLQRDRLSRELNTLQVSYTTLTQALEQARVDEVRDTPVITIIERPDFPVRPDSRQIVRRAFTALVVGALLGILWVLFRDVSSRAARLRD